MYAKKAKLEKVSDAQKRLKLQRVGETVFEKGVWSVNDEEVRDINELSASKDRVVDK